ncbi:uncharacterized protein [Haliotis cracherodii]|uniref:uncharacterized protein n=1 Tax=Haliotis cracherodii TaxID=6455 RepID=UPI0039E98061
MIVKVIIFSSLINVIASKINHGETIHDINNLMMNYTQEVCASILSIPCATHIPHGDENLCGTDLVLYNNHCLFAKARCNDGNVTLLNHGPCPQSPVTNDIITTSKVGVSEKPSSSPSATAATTDAGKTSAVSPKMSLPVTATTDTPMSSDAVTATMVTPMVSMETSTDTSEKANPATSSDKPSPSIKATSDLINMLMSTTDDIRSTDIMTQTDTVPMSSDAITASTVAPSTTEGVDPAFAIIHEVFCRNIHSITCGTSPTLLVCGTDGRTYSNTCIFSKTKCYKLDLEMTDPSFCGVTTTKSPVPIVG